VTEAEPYLLGRGRADITGEPAGVGMLGYGMAHQRTCGILQRQFSRAFIIVDRATDARVVYVVADIGMFFHNVRAAVLERLGARFGALYPSEGILLTATHTTPVPAAPPATGCTPPAACVPGPSRHSWTASSSRSSAPTTTWRPGACG